MLRKLPRVVVYLTVVVLILLVGLGITLAQLLSESNPVINQASPVVTITAVNDLGHGVCVKGASSGCFIAFIEGNARPVAGNRYYSHVFSLPLASGGTEQAILLVSDPLPGPS